MREKCDARMAEAVYNLANGDFLKRRHFRCTPARAAGGVEPWRGGGRKMTKRNAIDDARELRQRQTKAEALLWSVLRGKQVSNLKFRRQHPEPPYVLDFANCGHNLAVEIDGGYHDYQDEKDNTRERYLISKGWDIIRFSNEDVLADPEAVAIAIARQLKVEYEYRKRSGSSSSVADRQRIAKDLNNRNRT